MPPSLSTHNLTKIYNDGQPNKIIALNNVSLNIQPGDMVAIVGPSGSGKSTLLHLLGALAYPTSGTILIEGKDITKIPASQLHKVRAQQIGFVFQGFNLLPTLTVLENIVEPALYNGISRANAQERAKLLLEQLGLTDKANVFPQQLSGGQQQRVAIARALINQPAIILADEPTGELDTVNANFILDIFTDLNKRLNQTIVIITHNLEIAARCHYCITMRDGQIVEERKLHETK